MAGSEISLFDLELIRRRNLSEKETNIINAFTYGMRPATPEAAKEAVFWLDSFCPPLQQEEESNNYLWMVWEIMMDIARSPDATSEIHKCLVSILEDLRQCAKGELMVLGKKSRVWRDFPLLPMCMDACFNDPTIAPMKLTPESARKWRNVSAFGARCLGAGLAGSYLQAMLALQSALEEEIEDTGRTELRIQVASEWISHAAKCLLDWARENIGYEYVSVDDTANYIDGGPLYHGPSTMCLQRWGFWMDRFEQLGREESGLSEDVQKTALEAAQTMRTIERAVGNTL